MLEILIGVSMFTSVILTLVCLILIAKYKLVASGDITINVNEINSYTRIGNDNIYDSFIAKFSHGDQSFFSPHNNDWLKYLDFGGHETHNYFDINNEGELIMGITIDNSSTADEAAYIIKAYDNGTIIN